MATVTLSGLDVLSESLKRVPKDLAFALGSVATKIEAAIKHDIITMYNIPESRINKSLVGSRVTSTATKGKNFLQAGLEFKQIPIDLAKYPYDDKEWGNIPPLPKRRKGQIHKVAVRRGQVKVIHGKHGNGGFARLNTQKDNKYGIQMFERTSKSRYPLRILFGPSVANIVDWGMDNPNMLPTFDKVIAESTKTIADLIKL